MKFVLFLTIFISIHAFGDVRYNDLQQKSSHNSYARDEGILDQLVYHRIRSIEFDIYRESSQPRLSGDWYVYHFPIFDTKTNCNRLSDCFKELQIFDRQQPNHEVVTVWFDVKDGFAGSQTPEAFDRLIKQYLGSDDVISPSYLYSRCPGASNLKGAVSDGCSWPTLEDMRGKWIFVLTNSEYSSNRSDRLGFTAQSANNNSTVNNSRRIFFNTDSSSNNLSRYIHNEGFVSRRYVLNDRSSFERALSGNVNHIATNKVNYVQDSWSKTHNSHGWPFKCIGINCSSKKSIDDTISVRVNSEDIWGQSDHFTFLYQDKNRSGGRWTVAANSASSHVDEWAKACIMARVDKRKDSPYFAVCRPADKHRIRIQWRDFHGGDSHSSDKTISGARGISQKDLTYLKMDIYNEGKCAAGFGSRDGSNWTRIGTRCFSEKIRLQGIAASSHGNKTVKHLFSNTKYWNNVLNKNDFEKANIGTVRSASISDGSF